MGQSQTEGILSTVVEIRRGVLLGAYRWPEPGTRLGVTASDGGRWQELCVKGLTCHWSEMAPILQIQKKQLAVLHA